MTDHEEELDEYEHDNLHEVLRKLPLVSNVYLNMQAMNAGIVDFHIEAMERDLLKRYFEIERTPTIEALTVSAFSQMWVFSLYELLRTWRQRAKAVLLYGQKLAAAKGTERDELIAKRIEQSAQLGTHATDKGAFTSHAYERIERDPDAVSRIAGALDLVEPIFRLIESVRVTLAKHEIPKSPGLYADAPGYGRIDMSDGSIYWMIRYKDGSGEIVSRRNIADELRSISQALDQFSDRHS